MVSKSLIETLHSEKCSCVIENDGLVYTFNKKGVKDLYFVLTHSNNILKGASVADKVIGKGAAALMILGGVKDVYADVISEPALALLRESGIDVDYSELVPNIINRAGTGICPVETLCLSCATAEECLPLIEEFLKNK